MTTSLDSLHYASTTSLRKRFIKRLQHTPMNCISKISKQKCFNYSAGSDGDQQTIQISYEMLNYYTLLVVRYKTVQHSRHIRKRQANRVINDCSHTHRNKYTNSRYSRNKTRKLHGRLSRILVITPQLRDTVPWLTPPIHAQHKNSPERHRRNCSKIV